MNIQHFTKIDETDVLFNVYRTAFVFSVMFGNYYAGW